VRSDLSRMTFDRRTKLTLPNSESAKRDLWFLGALRPFVGAIFGLLMFGFLKSTLVPVELPADPTRQTFFLTSVAFLAGFIERFAQDVFLRSARAVAEDDRDPAPVGAAAGARADPGARGATVDVAAAIGALGDPKSRNGHAAPAPAPPEPDATDTP
jgi:hypothetical protein